MLEVLQNSFTMWAVTHRFLVNILLYLLKSLWLVAFASWAYRRKFKALVISNLKLHRGRLVQILLLLEERGLSYLRFLSIDHFIII